VHLCRNAFHLSFGKHGASRAVQDWLTHHQVGLLECSDTLEACATLLTDAAFDPQLALIAADRLAPGDRPILDYIRQTWVNAVLVLYGLDGAPGEIPPAVLCRCSPAEFRQMLSASPDALLSSRQTERQEPGAARPTGASQVITPSRWNAASGALPANPVSPRAALTPEELSALLDEEEAR